MIGDKKLAEPLTVSDAISTLKSFGFNTTGLVADVVRIFNAKRLVELNNEVYERYHQKWVEGYNQRIQDEQEEKV
jgi:hypothetical protein